MHGKKKRTIKRPLKILYQPLKIKSININGLYKANKAIVIIENTRRKSFFKKYFLKPSFFMIKKVEYVITKEQAKLYITENKEKIPVPII